jgi:REP element-mobilizing transposase RayT
MGFMKENVNAMQMFVSNQYTPTQALKLTCEILYGRGIGRPINGVRPRRLGLFPFFLIFRRFGEAKQHIKPLIVFMRPLRILGQGVWYEVRTRINNREPLFRRSGALALFAKVFNETMLRFVFSIRGLHLEDDLLTFYIKPEDGLELPDIMKWMKQVFAQRYNAAEGRIGHIWGDRYWSRILEGEPQEEAAAASGGLPANGVRPRRVNNEEMPCFFLTYPFPPSPAPG